MCLLSVVLFLGEQIRLTRAGYYLHTVEVWVNAAAPANASVLGWEHWGCIRRKSGDLEQRTRWVVGSVFALLAIGAAATGFTHVHETAPVVAFAALATALVGACVTVRWTVWLAGWVGYYRGLYGTGAAGPTARGPVA